MAKFNECSDADKILFIKDEFIRIIEELMLDPNKLKAEMPEETYKTVMDFVPSLKAPECNCGTCIQMDKLEARIPAELQSLVGMARKRCETRTY